MYIILRDKTYIRKASQMSFIVLSILSLIAIYPVTHISAGNYYDERFFLNISDYIIGTNSQEIKNKPILETNTRPENFQPSMKILSRILKVILEKNSIGKTSLSVESNVNYAKLQRYLQWLDGNHLVEFVIKDDKVHVTLSHKGREFTRMLSLL